MMGNTDESEITLTERQMAVAARRALRQGLRAGEMGIDVECCPPEEEQWCCVSRIYYGPAPEDFFWECIYHNHHLATYTDDGRPLRPCTGCGDLLHPDGDEICQSCKIRMMSDEEFAEF